ncbi:hypothetical protein I79_011269 [Cricetulus griseus]|uniref:Uncharacterized protein n=1 Tax=Cricetulus griseus TaxID=10029 RepID=G3HKP0_CRIGR|nr:hypothetical protein I79_011269 [Cricetulus griseus]
MPATFPAWRHLPAGSGLPLELSEQRCSSYLRAMGLSDGSGELQGAARIPRVHEVLVVL